MGQAKLKKAGVKAPQQKGSKIDLRQLSLFAVCVLVAISAVFAFEANFVKAALMSASLTSLLAAVVYPEKLKVAGTGLAVILAILIYVMKGSL